VTRVQLGIQHLDDQILDMVNRQCPTYKTAEAIYQLKENGFKVDGHFMPDLPGSSYEQDLTMFKYLFSRDNEKYQCDQLKIYPVMTTDYTEILKWYQEGRYQPYAELEGGRYMTDLLLYICTNVPYWIRLNRIVRDIPNEYIQGGLKRVNLRQDIDEILRQQGLKARDIRGREPKAMIPDLSDCIMWMEKYRSSSGDEYFISYENSRRTTIYGFVRLRLSGHGHGHGHGHRHGDQKVSDNPRYFRAIEHCALIRELHVYGEVVHQNSSNTGTQTQHLGLGKRLMAHAEKIAVEAGYRKVAVISGIGVRRYYKKLGYHLEDTYMVKDLTHRPPVRSLLIPMLVILIAFIYWVLVHAT